MRARLVFGVLLLAILLFTFGPALIALGSEFVAKAFGCETDFNRVVPCVIGGKDYGGTFHDLGFLTWYSYLTLPIGAVLAAIWAAAALVALVAIRRRQGRIVGRLSPGLSFLRGAAIAIALALSPILITFTAGMIAKAIGCDLNEVGEHACPVLGMDVGPALAAMANSIWFISLTVMAGLLALIVLFIIWIVRVLRSRRAQVDASGASA